MHTLKIHIPTIRIYARPKVVLHLKIVGRHETRPRRLLTPRLDTSSILARIQSLTSHTPTVVADPTPLIPNTKSNTPIRAYTPPTVVQDLDSRKNLHTTPLEIISHLSHDPIFVVAADPIVRARNRQITRGHRYTPALILENVDIVQFKINPKCLKPISTEISDDQSLHGAPGGEVQTVRTGPCAGTIQHHRAARLSGRIYSDQIPNGR